MAQTSIQVELSEPLGEYVEQRVEHGPFGNPGDYVRTLIREDRARRKEALDRELLESLHSGDIPVSLEDLASGDLVNRLREKAANRV